MSIKKGKKQVYKVGREVRVVECADMTREHLGIKGKIIDILEDGTYVVNGTTELCAAEKVTPLKPKKSIKKMYKVKRECDNCGEFYFVSIPFGTKKWDFFSEAASPKGKSIICKFCGC